jgi:predicted alpha-1,2-mannosidase
MLIFKRKNMKIFRFSLIGLITVGILMGCSTGQTASEKEKDLTGYVDPFIGTGFHGHTYPGAVLPFGRVQLSPDTRLNGWDACSGYHYSDSTIYGFSHTHLSGTGIGDMGDVLFLPYAGEVDDAPLATFSHSEEQASPGYYQVTLKPWDVKCELSATLRTGWHRYTYPQGSKPGLMIDLAHILQETWGNSVLEASLKVIDDRTIEGYRMTKGWAAKDPVWFRAEFNEPFSVEKIVKDGESLEGAKSAKGTNLKIFLSFEKLEAPLTAKVGISAVDAAGPGINLKEVQALQSFDEVVTEARKNWNETLEAIEIKSDDEDVLTNFYTSLYHSHLAPMVFSDADGRYRGMDHEIYNTNGKGEAYTVFSLWDTFRAWYPLMTIIEPSLSSQWVYSLYEGSQQGGLLPKWPLVANYTGTMVGYPALSLMADASTKELIDSIPDKLIAAAEKSATWQPEWHEQAKGTRAEMVMPLHIKYKESNGFVPVDKVQGSVSWGLEMAYYDWCLATMMENEGHADAAEKWYAKGQYYKHYFDPSTGFMRGKNLDGDWYADFNPNYSSHMKSEYVEGNAWQWSPFVPHDIEGFRELLGGEKAMGEWLDNLFTTTSKVEGENASADITGLIGQYAHGNEPSHHVAYMYQYTDRPWRTQEIVDTVLYNFYKPEPAGIIGNEDCGQMSAWYIMSALGFYQINPGEPVYTLGRPIVDEARIRVNEGWFEIIVHNNSPQNKYVKAVMLNGEKLQSNQFKHKDIQNGGKLEFFMSDKP